MSAVQYKELLAASYAAHTSHKSVRASEQQAIMSSPAELLVHPSDIEPDAPAEV